MTAIAAVTGESIALGIFLTPAAMARSLGSPLLVAAAWCSMAVMALCGALCYSELAVRLPHSGGDYVYLRAGFGERLAFLYGWMSAVVMYPGVAAALAVGATAYLAALLPLGRIGAAVTPALLLLLFGVIHLAGTRFSARILSTVNLLKLAVLFSLIFWAIASGRAHLAHLAPFAYRRPGSDALLPALAGAAVSAFFSFGGWWEAGKIAGSIRNPTRNLPIAFIGGVSVVTAVYLLISFVFLAVVPLEQVTSSNAFVAQFGAALFGAAGARVLSACVLVCVLGGMGALTMAAPRVCYAMAGSGLFLAPFGRLHPRFGTPANAILLQTGLSLLALLLGAFDRILSYIIFSAVVFLALTASSLFRMRTPVRRWWYPAAPAVFIASCAAIAILILLHNPLPALLGAALVLCGDPLRRIFLRPAPPANQLPNQPPDPALTDPPLVERT